MTICGPGTAAIAPQPTDGTATEDQQCCELLSGTFTLNDANPTLPTIGGCVVIEGSLTIEEGPFDPLHLRRISETLTVFNYNSTKLEVLTGLQRVGSLNIMNTTNLASLDGLESLTHASNGIAFYHLPLLTSVRALYNLKEVSALSFTKTPKISDTVSFANLETLSSILYFADMDISEFDFSNFKNLKHIGNLTFNGVDTLPDWSGFESLESIGRLGVIAVHGITTLEMFEDIAIDSLWITFNGFLQSLHGLEHLTALDSIRLKDNSSLARLDGLQNVTQVNTLEIMENGLLCPSLVNAFRDQLQGVVNTSIYQNGGGASCP